MRINFCLVICKGLKLGIGQKLKFGDANSMLARNYTVQRPRQHHDASHRLVCGLQHGVVITVDRNIGVHITVTRMHVQSDPNSPLQYALMNCIAFRQDGLELSSRKNVLQHRTDLCFPTCTQRVILKLRKQNIAIIQPLLPESAHLGN